MLGEISRAWCKYWFTSGSFSIYLKFYPKVLIPNNTSGGLNCISIVKPTNDLRDLPQTSAGGQGPGSGKEY